MRIDVEVRDPVYACDVKGVLDHEHPGFFECQVELPQSVVGADECSLIDAIEEAIRNDLGICLLDGEVSYVLMDPISYDEEDFDGPR